MGMRISSMLISVLLVGLFASVIFVISTALVTKYNTGDDTSRLNAYSQTLEPIKNNLDEIKEKEDTISSSSKLDVIGDFFNQGYSALKITGNSFVVIDNVTNQALQDSQLGDTTSIFKSYITIIIIVIVFVAIFLAILVRYDL